MAAERRHRLGAALPYLIAVVLTLTSIGFTVGYVAQLQTQLQAACGFAHDLGGVSLPASPKPSRLGVSIVADSRAQWRELRCPGTLPPAPGLAHWAKVYGLPGS